MSEEDYEYMEQFYASTTCNISTINKEDTFINTGETLCRLDQFKVQTKSAEQPNKQKRPGCLSTYPRVSCLGGVLHGNRLQPA